MIPIALAVYVIVLVAVVSIFSAARKTEPCSLPDDPDPPRDRRIDFTPPRKADPQPKAAQRQEHHEVTVA